MDDQNILEKVMDRKELAAAFNSFLESLPETERLVFLSRYWYLDPISDIAQYHPIELNMKPFSEYPFS